MTEQTNDGLAVLAEKLAIKRSGWHRIEGPDGVAVFPSVPVYTADSPEQRRLENAWEAKAMAQAAESERMERANRIEGKPEENSLAARKAQITRGD